MPEFGSWMVESTPIRPYTGYANDLLRFVKWAGRCTEPVVPKGAGDWVREWQPWRDTARPSVPLGRVLEALPLIIVTPAGEVSRRRRQTL